MLPTRNRSCLWRPWCELSVGSNDLHSPSRRSKIGTDVLTPILARDLRIPTVLTHVSTRTRASYTILMTEVDIWTEIICVRLVSNGWERDLTAKKPMVIDKCTATGQRDRSSDDLEYGVIVLNQSQHETRESVIILTILRAGIERPRMRTTPKTHLFFCQIAYVRKAISTWGIHYSTEPLRYILMTYMLLISLW